MKTVYKVLIVIGIVVAGFGAYYGGIAVAEAEKEFIRVEVRSYYTAHKAELKGDQGIQGVAGVQGATGTAGANGAKGSSGATGSAGASGAAGAAGKAGQAGCTWLGWSNNYPYYDLGFSCPK